MKKLTKEELIFLKDCLIDVYHREMELEWARF